jgi:hypothetical protein
MINGNRMHLSSNSSLIAKGLNTYANKGMSVFRFVIMGYCDVIMGYCDVNMGYCDVNMGYCDVIMGYCDVTMGYCV